MYISIGSTSHVQNTGSNSDEVTSPLISPRRWSIEIPVVLYPFIVRNCDVEFESVVLVHVDFVRRTRPFLRLLLMDNETQYTTLEGVRSMSAMVVNGNDV